MEEESQQEGAPLTGEEEKAALLEMVATAPPAIRRMAEGRLREIGCREKTPAPESLAKDPPGPVQEPMP